MGHKNDCLRGQNTLENIVEDIFPDVGVQGGKTVIDEVDITVLVDSSGEGDSLLLASTEVDPSFSDLGQVLSRKLLDIGEQLAVAEDFFVPLLIEFLPEENIILEGGVLEPGLCEKVEGERELFELIQSKKKNRF